MISIRQFPFPFPLERSVFKFKNLISNRSQRQIHFRSFSHSSFGNLNPENEKEALELIKKTVEENPLVIFMKGTTDRPQCGFSKTLIQILQQYPQLQSFTAVNVLSNEQIRSAIKKFSTWPTIPQLFVKGNFVGGCDIVYEMYRNGSLQELFEKEKLFIESENESK